MRSTFAVVAAFAAAAYAAPGGVTADITPTGAAPAGCTSNYPAFELNVVDVAASKMGRREAKKDVDTLTVTLTGGILTDNLGRRGYIASNDQFQFDEPPVQAGAIYTGGFTVCANTSLALGDSAIWYACDSGNFYNLYDESIASYCKEIYLEAIEVSSTTGISTTTATATATAAATSVSSSTTSVNIISTISDNQPQASTSASASVTSVAVVKTSASTTSVNIISTISDNQPQAATTASASTTSIAVVSVTAYNATSTLASYTGAAAMPTMAAQFVLAAAGVVAMVL